MIIRQRSSFVGFAIITVLMGAVSAYVYRIPEQQMSQGQWVMHTHEVLGELEVLSSQLTQAKAAHGEYLLGRELKDYNDYQAYTKRAGESLQQIETLTKDNPVQQARIKPLRDTITNHLARLAQDMNPENAVTAAPVSTPATTEAAAIVQTIETMRAEEDRLLDERLANWHKAVSQTRMFFLGAIIALYLFILFAYVASRREARFREQLLEIESETASAQRAMASQLTEVIEIQQAIVAQRLNLQKAMEVITKRTQHITRADGAVIEMLEGDEMVYRAASGNLQGFVDFRIKAKGSLSGLCVESAQMLRCDDSELDDRVDKEACRKVGVRSMIVVPLIQQRETVGVLKVASSRAEAFTVEDVGTLQLMAGLLSATLRDAVELDVLQDTNQSLTMSNTILKTQKAQLESDKDALKNRADTDGMTGLKNFRYFEEHLAQEFERAKRYKNDLSLLMLDVDHFKQFNDQFGHPAGDTVLKQIAQLLKKCARPSDTVARYGGEEFVMILPQTDAIGAMAMAERLRQTIHEARWEMRRITVSIGISSAEHGAISGTSLVEQADKALYESKTSGRDKVTKFRS